jgi:two-component system, OmpR family, alkaline phosphatase synthesis response regulator PhoP
MKRRILLVEDEPGLSLTLSDRLKSEGYDVEAEADGEAGYQRAVRGGLDLMILDIMLPSKNGFDVCKDLRHKGVDLPVLMLTAMGKVDDRVRGLKLGGDDYLVKPFEMMELLARVEALLRRSPTMGPGQLESHEFGDIRVDFRRAEVSRESKPVVVSAREFQLLRYFIEHREAVIAREELLEKVWGYGSTPQTRTVDVHVAWLRQKLEPDPRHPQWIITLHGLGYKFVG